METPIVHGNPMSTIWSSRFEDTAALVVDAHDAVALDERDPIGQKREDERYEKGNAGTYSTSLGQVRGR